ncbi:hypothetical protein TVAG_417430 [Trichomonas vaginalis G3]|uniref:Uncharacterized protein n=1 Tax=Trichomonas vaginalis (strain ATCC PRA-98 / G3) TaxID=412133 RepID=A2F5Z5_TRIV3|nr:hypothetical protein TVAGG3_1054100 [Trichomonas vaginalis G3]EAX99676.1 hypothetical protein TVAG_417430 [Trichomonas vaginalis G3]KAI5494336.1 hypothetical protein TVAGG3_1054100 [Trichomonas vaginalis G3]|eukprot:XP_001312606.1 hypothetical protein [Trichomonas vaginalis G3]
MDQTDPRSFQIDSEAFIQWVIGALSIITFVTCIIYFFANEILSVIIFYSAAESFHLFRIVRFVAPKLEIPQNVTQKVLMCQDFYMFILCLLFIVTESTNYFVVLDYAVNTLIESLHFFVHFLAPWMGVEGPFVAKLRSYINNQYIPIVSAIIEVCVTISFFIQAITKFSFTNLIIFVGYFFLVIVASLATTEAHGRFWAKIGLFLREFAASRNDKLGQYVELVVEKCSHFASVAQQYFPKKDIKVHLQ